MKKVISLVHGGSAVVKHSAQHPKVECLSTATTAFSTIEKMMKKAIILVHGGSKVVKHSAQHPKVECLSTTTTAISAIVKMMKKAISFVDIQSLRAS